jgi:hypothetical protein
MGATLMNKWLPWIFVGMAAAQMPTAAPIFAQTSASTPPAPPPPFRLDLGSLMVGSVQTRHIKIAIAGKDKNWAYAAYSLHELQEAIELIARYFPQSSGKPVGQMITDAMKGPIADLSASIKDMDSEKFSTAFAALTDACNQCHQATDHREIVIKVPESASFLDEEFSPSKP